MDSYHFLSAEVMTFQIKMPGIVAPISSGPENGSVLLCGIMEVTPGSGSGSFSLFLGKTHEVSSSHCDEKLMVLDSEFYRRKKISRTLWSDSYVDLHNKSRNSRSTFWSFISLFLGFVSFSFVLFRNVLTWRTNMVLSLWTGSGNHLRMFPGFQHFKINAWLFFQVEIYIYLKCMHLFNNLIWFIYIFLF